MFAEVDLGQEMEHRYVLTANDRFGRKKAEYHPVAGNNHPSPPSSLEIMKSEIGWEKEVIFL